MVFHRLAGMTIAIAVALAGCGEHAPPAPPTTAAAKPTPEAEHAARLKKAEAGDAEAQALVAIDLLRGTGVARDPAKAIEWAQKSAQSGNARGQGVLGWAYVVGDVGLPQDFAKAHELLEKAATAGISEAQNDLGYMYHLGQGLPVDSLKAIAWYEKAAAQNNHAAMFDLGNLYLSPPDDKTEPNNIKGYQWANKAAEGGFANAQSLMCGAAVYEEDKQTSTTGLEWCKKMAAQGDPTYMEMLGERYLQGAGTAADPAKGIEWLEKAAEKGSVTSALTLFGTYSEGRDGVAKDPVKALAGIKRLAESSDEGFGSRELGFYYLDDTGIPVDVDEGVKWLRKAASTGDTSAAEALKAMGLKDAQPVKDFAKALERYRKWQKRQKAEVAKMMANIIKGK